MKTLENKISYIILLVIGFQAFPVLSLGGSYFKFYELLGLIMLFIGFRIDKNVFLKACFAYFVICPFVSLLWGWGYMGYPYHYFTRYAHAPEAHSLKMNYYVFPVFALIFMFANYAVMRTIFRDDWLYVNIGRALKALVKVGTVISFFSLLAMVGLNVKHLLPIFDAANSDYGGMRSLGFSKEPSTYVVFQTWIVLFAVATKGLFKRRTWRMIMLLNVASLVFTFSSAIVAFALVAAVSPLLIFKSSKKMKVAAIIIVAVLIIGGFAVITYLGLTDSLIYIYQDKIEHFFSPSDHTTDSGAFRNLTSRIGYKIWVLSPIFGVGVPMSTYYMHLFENKMGIATWGEEIGPMHFPQNAYSQTLAELGVCGFVALCFMLFIVVKHLWKLRRKDRLVPYLLMGVVCNMAYLFSNATLYSFYLWIFIAFSAGYCFYVERCSLISR